MTTTDVTNAMKKLNMLIGSMHAFEMDEHAFLDKTFELLENDSEDVNIKEIFERFQRYIDKCQQYDDGFNETCTVILENQELIPEGIPNLPPSKVIKVASQMMEEVKYREERNKRLKVIYTRLVLKCAIAGVEI